jgi:hypothetical protein
MWKSKEQKVKISNKFSALENLDGDDGDDDDDDDDDDNDVDNQQGLGMYYGEYRNFSRRESRLLRADTA